MNPSIPANQFVNVIPSVLQAGANDLGMNSVWLDNSGDTSIPEGTVLGFGSSEEVADWYGANSIEATLAGIYFAGYNGGQALPSALYFVQYNTAAVAAYLRGGPLTGVALTALQALTGVIALDVDGRLITSASINLSSATSFSNVAALIQAGLQSAGSAWTGTLTTATSTTVTINSTVTGSLKVGDVLVGTDIPMGAFIESFGTYTVVAGTGTVIISSAATGTVGPEAGTAPSTVTASYDPLRNAFVVTSPTTGADSAIGFPNTDAFVTGLFLTSAKGAVLSQGAEATTPAETMDTVVGQTQDWATFMFVQDPDSGAAGGPVKLAASTWCSEQNDQYMFIGYDSDPLPFEETDSACYGALVAALNGTFPILSSSQGQKDAAFVASLTASIAYRSPGGRTSFAYRASPSVTPDVSDLDSYLNATANGYNTYCNVATRTTQFQWLQRGTVSGDFKWADSYVNQIFWNSVFQNDFAELLTQVPAIPYNPDGYNMIRQSLAADIVAMGAFGAWVAGGVLSGSETVAVNTAAGIPIASTIQSQGWYLLVSDPGATVRGNRGSPIVKFFYFDGQSVQTIIMSSVDVE